MDELSVEANMDAVDFRLMHLSDIRAKYVIESAAEAFGWPGKNSEGVGCGLAFGQYKNIKTYAAVAIEVEVTDNAEIKLRRAVIAVCAAPRASTPPHRSGRWGGEFGGHGGPGERCSAQAPARHEVTRLLRPPGTHAERP